MFRVTSSLWVGAYTRRCFAEGAAAAVMRHGADEAGAIFVVIDRLDGSLDLYGPAPQSEIDRPGDHDRLFQLLLPGATGAAVQERLARETRFDPDVWIVGVDDRAGLPRLDLV